MRKQLTYIAPRQVGIMMGTIHGLLGLLLLPFILLKAVLTSKVSGLEAIITCSIWVLLTPVLYAVGIATRQ